MSRFDLTAPESWHLGVHNFGAAMGVPKWSPVAVEQDGAHYVITSDQGPVHVASAKRWVHYRFGWQARVARLFRHFAVDDVVTLKPGDQVIDIGANVGEFSIGAADRGASVLAIEGDPVVFDCLTRNVAAHTAITPHHALVWKQAEELTFYSAPAKADSSIFKPTSKQAVQTISQMAYPLDDLADGLDRIDLIKCDAEGAEPEVLEGAAKVLERTRQIALDTGPEREGAETGVDCERILKGHGFTVSHSEKGRKITFGRRV